MVGIAGSFKHFKPTTILVVGDLMLDTYTYGAIDRISPEAPVPVLKIQSLEKKAGGAGNVILNLHAMGAKVLPMGRVGQDEAGTYLLKHFESKGVSTELILEDSSCPTPIKNRLIASNQQLMRLDDEHFIPLSLDKQQLLIDQLEKKIHQVDIIALSDYGKGLLTKSFLKALIDLCNKHCKKVIVDPKGTDFSKYQGVYLIKPNLKEAILAANAEANTPLSLIAKALFKNVDFQYLMITRSKDGITFFNRQLQRWDVPARVKEVNDVTGAGDTVLSMICFAMSNDISLNESAHLANIAAGLAIEHFGCVAITLPELAQRMLELDERNKVFEAGHLYALKAALDNESFALLTLDQMQEITPDFFKALQGLSKDQKLVILLRGKGQTTFKKMLVSLKEVDFIVVDEERKRELEKELDPTSHWHYSLEKQLLNKL